MKLRLKTFLPIFASLLILISYGCGLGGDDESETIIAGQVTEQGTGSSIEGAIVSITSPSKFAKDAVTDSIGNFTFTVKIDSSINVSMEASKAGFNTNTKQPFKVAPGNDVDDVEFQLEPEGSGDGDDDDDGVQGNSAGPAVIELESIQRSSIAISGTGGSETSAFTFVVRDSAGRIVEEPAEVDFNILRGPDGGEYIDNPNPFTDNGKITAALVSGDSAGAVKIEARIERPNVGLTITSTPVLVSIGNGFTTSSNFNIAPRVNNYEGFGIIAPEGSVLAPNIIVASLGDYRNNPVLPGTSVSFYTEYGGKITQNAITDEDGFAVVELFADGSTPSGHPSGIGFITVYAETVDENDNAITTQTDVLFTTQSPIVNLSPVPFSIPSDGSETFTLTVTDQNGYPMAAGTTISIGLGENLSTQQNQFEVPDSFTPGPGTTQFTFDVSDTDDENSNTVNTSIQIVVTTPGGVSTTFGFSGTRAKNSK